MRLGLALGSGPMLAPFATIDFANGGYSFAGGTTLADVCVEDAVNFDTFNPAAIVAGQGLPSGQYPAFSAALTAYVIAHGASVVVHLLNAGDAAGSFGVGFANVPTFTDYYQVYMEPSGGASGSLLQAGTLSAAATALPAGEVRLSATFNTSGDMALSVNGGAVQTKAADVPLSSATEGGVFTYSTGAYIRSLRFYPVQANAALPGLSA